MKTDELKSSRSSICQLTMVGSRGGKRKGEKGKEEKDKMQDKDKERNKDK